MARQVLQPTFRGAPGPAVRFSATSRPAWTLDRTASVPISPPRPPVVAIAPPRALEPREGVRAPTPVARALRHGVARAPDRVIAGPEAVGSAYDACLAVGRDHLLIAQNFTVAIYAKASGASVSPTDLREWFPNRPAEANFVFDPRAIFDQGAGRWIVLALAWDQQTVQSLHGSWLLLSVSDSADPTGSWRAWAFDTFNDPATPGGWADHPCVGIDERAVYVTYNVQAGAARLFVFPKTDLYGEGAANHFDFRDLANADGNAASTIYPCHHFGVSPSTYLVNTMPAPNGSRMVTLWVVTWMDGTPSVSPVDVTIDEYRDPPQVTPQAQEMALSVGGTRVRSAVCRDDSVWFAFAAGTAGANAAGVAVRWYRLEGRSGEPIAHDVLTAPGAAYVFPGLAVDRSGNLTMVASQSTGQEHPSLHYASWPSGGAAATGLLVAGRGPHLRCRGNLPCSDPTARNGWGDYNGIALDPDDETTVWMYGGVGHETDKTLWATSITTLGARP